MPVFNVIAKSRSDLAMLNDLLIGYANFLIEFNEANNDSESRLEASAEKIGNSVASISSRFGKKLDTQKIGAFSTIGMNAVQQLLARKQRDGMAAVMQDFHPGVQEFALLGEDPAKVDKAEKRLAQEIKKLRVNMMLDWQGDAVELMAKLRQSNEQAQRRVRELKEAQDRTEELADILGLIDRGLASVSGLLI